jgi:hypothetical protein
MNFFNWRPKVLLLLVIITTNCNTKQKEVEETQAPVTITVKPEVVASKDTFDIGEKVKAKVYLSRTDYKTLAIQDGIKDYLKVYFYHGEHILQIDSLEEFDEALVEFDTAYIEFQPRQVQSEFDIIAYPYDVIIKVNYNEAHEGFDTTFIWRQEALLKKK